MSEAEGPKQYLCSIGSNLDPYANFGKALLLLAGLFSPVSVSRIVRTQPHGMATDRCFLNALLMFTSELNPAQVKLHCNRIETACGRNRDDPASSMKDREADIDIFPVGASRDPRDAVLGIPYLRELGEDLLPGSGSFRPDGIAITVGSACLGQRPSTVYLDPLTGDIRVVDQVVHGL